MPSKESEETDKKFSGRSVAKNSFYNLFGYGIPLILAVAFIPSLIKGLGEERFGVLNLAWMVIGYFSFFDFGIGRSLTKIIAEKIGLGHTKEIPGIFWTSLFLMSVLGLFGTTIFIIATPYLVTNFFNISITLQPEMLKTFYALALSIPIITTSAGLRGVLEAYQDFGIMNIIRIVLGIFTFLGPLLCLFVTTNLFWIIVFLLVIRIIVSCLYMFRCFKINDEIRNGFKFEPKLILPVLKLSGWMTVSNIVGPLITYLDRFLIGAILTASAITYYATPYEVVTKLFLIPSALVGVLLPVFSASYLKQPQLTKKLFIQGTKFIFIFLYPIILIIMTFSYEGMDLWLDKKFADQSALTLQLLSIGVLFNSLTHLPFVFLQGIGKPHIPAKINLIQLPFYVIAMWFSIKEFGINGAASVLLLLYIVNTIIQFTIANNILKIQFGSIHGNKFIIITTFCLIIPFLITGLYVKIIFSTVSLILFLTLTWRYFLIAEEKLFLRSVIDTSFKKELKK